MDIKSIVGRFKKEPSQLDENINELEERMYLATCGTDEYETLMAEYKGLCAIRKENEKKPIDPNILIQVGCTVGCTLLILTFDKFTDRILDVRAFNWIPKPRVY